MTGSKTTTFPYDAAGRRTGQASPELVVGYAYDASGTEAGELSVHRPTGQAQWLAGALYQRDPAGNIVGVTDVKHPGTTNYSPHGVATAGQTTDEAALHFGFGGELTLQTSEVDLRARSCDPVTGQFLQTDPLGGVVGSPTVSNPYHHGDNDPVNNFDPLGLRPAPKHDKYNYVSLGAGVLVGGGCLVITSGAGSAGCIGAGMAVYKGADSYQEDCMDGQSTSTCFSNVAKDAGIGFVGGYLSTVAFEGPAGLVGEGLFGSMFAGGAGAFTQSGLDQILTAGHLDMRRLAFDTAIGAGTAGLFHGAGKGLSAVSEARATRALQRSLVEDSPGLISLERAPPTGPATPTTEAPGHAGTGGSGAISVGGNHVPVSSDEDFAVSQCELGVKTPYGTVVQSPSPEALELRASTLNGTEVFRQGEFDVQETTEGQFWSPVNPASTSGYAGMFGIPQTSQIDWIMGGEADPGFITREAPGYGNNPGSAPDVVTLPGGVRNLWFHMPD